MSQTETLLLVVLGFALATLLALFIGRLLWAAALKIGARRMQKQVPTTLVGLQTERDRLRAEYAMLSQRLSSRLEAAKLRMAEQMAEVSRHRNRLDEAESRNQTYEAELSALKDQLASLNRELSEAHSTQAGLQQTIAAQQAAFDQIEQELAAGLSRPQPRLAFDSQNADVAAGHRARSRIDQLNELAHTVASERSQLGEPQFDLSPPELPTELPTDPMIISRLRDAEQETGDLQQELEKLDAEWSKRLDGLTGTETPTSTAGSGPMAVANVISLANRIRDLKKGLGTN
jgi:DNA repair exonuclease SbcCD ATPase subunit